MTTQQRKENSEAQLRSLGIIANEGLPLLDHAGYTLRSPQQVARRVLILTYLNCVASEPSLQQETMMFLIREKLWDEATPEEQALFHNPQLSDEDIDNIFWRKESIWMLLWVIGKVDDVGLPDKEVNLYEIFPLLPGFFESTADFIETASRRAEEGICALQDFYFRLNWMMNVENVIPNTPLVLGVVHERYLSVSWVTGMNEVWI